MPIIWKQNIVNKFDIDFIKRDVNEAFDSQKSMKKYKKSMKKVFSSVK